MSPGVITRKRAVLYLRISDDREGKKLGVERQEQLCRELAERLGVEIVEVYRDNDISASGKKMRRRPDYERMLAAARKHQFDMIISYSNSRLTRRVLEHEALIDLAVEHRISYAFVASPSFDLNSADGRMIARILVAADAAEAQRISERVTARSLQRAQSGGNNGGPRAFGISADGKSLVESEAERIKDWYTRIQGGTKLFTLAAEANTGETKIPSVNGKPWRPHVIRRILLNERNAGLRFLEVKDEDDPNLSVIKEFTTPHKEIVSREIYDDVVRILTDDSRRTNHVGTARRHVGTGLFICERCARTVNTGQDQRGRTVYRCLGCFRTWRAEPINDWIDELIEGILGKPDFAEILKRPAVPGIDTVALHAERKAIRGRLDAMAAKHVLGQGVTESQMLAANEAANARITEISSMLADAGRVSPLVAVAGADDPVRAYRDLKDLGRKQSVIRSLIRVQLGEPIRGRRKWEAEQFIKVTEA